jgi:hypothetical protein
MNLTLARSISLDSTFKDDFAGQVEVGGKVLKMTEEVVDSAGIADCTSSSPCETLPCRYCTRSSPCEILPCRYCAGGEIYHFLFKLSRD